MKSTSSINNNKGFSLVELMVVVAIIGVLASIAVPNINKYIAKSRQTEVKGLLSALYTSEKAFYAEYNAYDSRFGAIGFAPEGKLRYDAGFGGTNTNAGAAQGYTTTPAITAVKTTTNCGAAGTMSNGCTILNDVANAAPSIGTNGAVTVGPPAFTAFGGSHIFKSGVIDTWSMTDSKVLSNTIDGIN